MIDPNSPEGQAKIEAFRERMGGQANAVRQAVVEHPGELNFTLANLLHQAYNQRKAFNPSAEDISYSQYVEHYLATGRLAD